MKLDPLTRQAIQHTYHCLIGCGIGEVLGMFIAASLGWHGPGRIILAVSLAFFFGYLFTFMSVRKYVPSKREAMRITLATDTVSIATMEIVANSMELLIPGALMAMPSSPSFWGSLALSMAIAFVLTVPVNRYMISRRPHDHMHHGH